MILVLTYHKITANDNGEEEFYSVKSEALARQLELLESSGLYALCPDELLTYKERGNPAYILTFDDGSSDHFELVLPLLAQYGRKGIFFVPTSKLNQPGYLSTEALKKMRQAGHCIGSHSHEHRRLDRCREEDIRVQIQLSLGILREAIGEAPWSFAPPGGYFDRRIQKVALENGVRVVRTMRWGYNRHLDPTSLECTPINRHTTTREFSRILAFRNIGGIYVAKELVKRFVPLTLYNRLRRVAFRAFGRE
jgi:peptidoglycan/xylan/chitin deacetylase (PgdA/CDA1 family)